MTYLRASMWLALTLWLGFAAGAHAQPGWVLSYQKISATEGGFGGQLSDGDGLGSAIEPIGDFDGNGVTDLAVGCRWSNAGGTDQGAVFLLFMAADGTVVSQQEISAVAGGFGGALDPGDRFGSSVAALGDLDENGVVDLAVGAVGDDDGASWAGAVWILFMNADGTVMHEQKISYGHGGFPQNPGRDDELGVSLVSLGDFDGDLIPDLMATASGDDDGDTNSGAAWLFLLNRDGTIKDYQKISATEGGFEGPLDLNDRFGSGAAGLGDLDEDGVVDVAVSSTLDDDGAHDAGAIWILFLNADGTVKAQQKISATEGGFDGLLDEGDLFGIGLSSLPGAEGDVDGDGVQDLMAGALRDDDGGPDRGAVWVLFLNRDGTVKGSQKISSIEGGFGGTLDDGDEFGWGLGLLRDSAGDGGLLLGVGAPDDDDGGLDYGAVWLLSLDSAKCLADFNGDGLVDTRDFIAFLNAWAGRDPAADFDGNGVIDTRDVVAYLNAWAEGC